MKYFSEIANLFEGGGIELEERTVVCGNALEETRGRELELATNMILSRILQTLLEGCDLDQLCSFLLSCAKEFPFIAMDKSGSHVAETALKSLALHLQDEEAYASIEETLTKICELQIFLEPLLWRRAEAKHNISKVSNECLQERVIDKPLKNNDDFVWAIETPLAGKFIIDVEFLNLKIADPVV